jgi:hypothetical protein
MKRCPFCETPIDDTDQVKCIVETDELENYYSAQVHCFVCGARGPCVDNDTEDADISSISEACCEAWRRWNWAKRKVLE